MQPLTRTIASQVDWPPGWLTLCSAVRWLGIRTTEASPVAQYPVPSKASALNERIRPSAGVGGRETVGIPIQLVGEVAGGWRIRQALPIDVDREDDGSFLVSDDIFLVYGQGATLEEAQNDYVSALTELYRLVESDASQDAFSKKELEHLRLYLLPPVASPHAPQEY